MGPLSSHRPREAALTDALLGIVADRGLDQVSVREVASAAGVSVGTVQHYFPTKDHMLAAAFTEVVRRIRHRVSSVCYGPSVRGNISAVLHELLPLDDLRSEEVRIQLAFAARAAHSPALATIQRSVLIEVTDALTEALAAGGVTHEHCRAAARVALAAADGLAVHAVSSHGWLAATELTGALELLLDALVPAG